MSNIVKTLEHGIYKYVYNEEIIYIGKTDNSFSSRINAHSNEPKFRKYVNKSKIFVHKCNNWIDADIYEKYLINKYKPLLNVAYKIDGELEIEIIEPKWIPYEELKTQKKNSKRKPMDPLKLRCKNLNNSISSTKKRINKLENEIARISATYDILERIPYDITKIDNIYCITTNANIPSGLGVEYKKEKLFISATILDDKLKEDDNSITWEINMDYLKDIYAHYDQVIHNLKEKKTECIKKLEPEYQLLKEKETTLNSISLTQR